MNVCLAIAAIVAAVVAFSSASCASQDDAANSNGTWVGAITTEGNVTTVVNESGPVWGGTATLVGKRRAPRAVLQ